MNLPKLFAMAIILGVGILASVTARAQNIQMFPEVKSYINCYEHQQDSQTAIQCLNQASTLALQRKDVVGLATLSYIYLYFSPRNANYERYAVYYYEQAVRAASEWANDPRPSSERNRSYGRVGLEYLINFYKFNMQHMQVNQAMLQAIRQQALFANNALRLTPNGEEKNTATISAVAGNNSLVPAGYPIRGFGDSDKVDTWVPFRFATANYYGIDRLTSAKVRMVVKPIGQLIGTDQLILRGASGKSYVIYDKFDQLKANQWNTVTVDLRNLPDLMQAIQNGSLEGVIEDDSAVQSVELIIGTK